MFSAKEFATIYHDGQEYGDDLYVKHLEEVDKTVRKYLSRNNIAFRNELLSATWLHDILEDTQCTFDILCNHFGKEVSVIVWMVSDPQGRNRRERKKKLYMKFRNASFSSFDEGLVQCACLLKAADRLVNLRQAKEEFLEMYRGEHTSFKNAFYNVKFDELWKEMEEILNK